jgi:hypothetical protein
MTESWLQSASDISTLRVEGSRWYENWRSWQSLMSVAQAAGLDFFGLTYGSGNDARAMRYVRASFLLGWNGRGGALIYDAIDRDDPYSRAWVRQIGGPLGRMFERGPGVWQRRYERGVVIVNATAAPVTVRLDGKLRTLRAADALMVTAAG